MTLKRNRRWRRNKWGMFSPFLSRNTRQCVVEVQEAKKKRRVVNSNHEEEEQVCIDRNVSNWKRLILELISWFGQFSLHMSLSCLSWGWKRKTTAPLVSSSPPLVLLFLSCLWENKCVSLSLSLSTFFDTDWGRVLSFTSCTFFFFLFERHCDCESFGGEAKQVLLTPLLSLHESRQVSSSTSFHTRGMKW